MSNLCNEDSEEDSSRLWMQFSGLFFPSTPYGMGWCVGVLSYDEWLQHVREDLRLEKENRKSVAKEVEMLTCRVPNFKGRLLKYEDISEYFEENDGSGAGDHEGGGATDDDVHNTGEHHLQSVEEAATDAAPEDQPIELLGVEGQPVQVAAIEKPDVGVLPVEVPLVEQMDETLSAVEVANVNVSPMEVAGVEKAIVEVLAVEVLDAE
ncbi:hypothetical protein Cgig2_019041 [Carnegiea gigantea]|uniref:Uncharacterized protein n=1 Tax=Carnegiea gigantea TaxID=171969 RepID=A0A9Q1JL17_9CARY|nr:hypothetical protein Cgig2_019041 [Carnegiea gigantea]